MASSEYMREYRKDPAKRERGRQLQKEWYQRNKKEVLEKQKKKHNSLRQDIIQKLGGCCSKCGTKENLEFNHIDPVEKITEASYTNVMATTDEWKKCELLCRSCHREYTNSENILMRQHWLKLPLEVRRQLIDEYIQSETF